MPRAADIYAPFGRTCEGHAADHAILAVAGVVVTSLDGSALDYGRAPNFYVAGFIAWG